MAILENRFFTLKIVVLKYKITNLTISNQTMYGISVNIHNLFY